MMGRMIDFLGRRDEMRKAKNVTHPNLFDGELIPKSVIRMGTVFRAVGEGYGVVYRDTENGEVMEACGVDGSRYIFIESDYNENMYKCIRREPRKAHMARLSQTGKKAFIAKEQQTKGMFPTGLCSQDVETVHVLGSVTYVPVPTLAGEVSIEEAGRLLEDYLRSNALVEESDISNLKALEIRSSFKVISAS